jgi:hypothetical protein
MKAALATLFAFTSIAQAQHGPSAAEHAFSARAFDCKPYSLAELNSMSQFELGGAYCSYRVSLRLEAMREVEYKAGYAKNPENFEEALKFSRHWQQRCTPQIKKTIDVLSRRFPGPVPDCSSMWKALLKEASEGGQF